VYVVCLEPICAIGMGVAGLFSATNRDGSWKFKGYSMTSVSCVTACVVDTCMVISITTSYVNFQYY